MPPPCPGGHSSAHGRGWLCLGTEEPCGGTANQGCTKPGSTRGGLLGQARWKGMDLLGNRAHRELGCCEAVET